MLLSPGALVPIFQPLPKVMNEESGERTSKPHQH